MPSPAAMKRTAADRPGTTGRPGGSSERWSTWAMWRSRPYACALAIATEASWPSWARIASSRGVNSRSARSATSSIPSGRPALRSMTPIGVPVATPGWPSAGHAALSPRAYGSPADAVMVARHAPSTDCAASTVSWRTSSVVIVALIRTDASASARSCITCSCSSRATSCTSR
jgi:hypothetical protein